ncbi:MAG: hypothetical protein Kow0088_23550 [Anaerolineales bacterium]
MTEKGVNQSTETEPMTRANGIGSWITGWMVPSDDRGRMRMVVDSLILHLHPAKVPQSTLRWSYTWGLGGLSALLIVILGITGMILLNNYTAAAPQAYLDVLELRADVWFGDWVRNLHHWSANLLMLVAVLHLVRVFLTASYRPPRHLNWLIGWGMLLLIAAANFTGYLLPWDQLAYWAVTVGSSLITYLPFIGEGLARLVLGGTEVSTNTLQNFYALHISFIPLLIFGLMSYHFWRVRKDGGLSIPKASALQEETRLERVTTIPHLVQRELVFALVWIALLILFAGVIPAPLEGIANPNLSPNPAKAPWYFLGFQELLLHFHPLVVVGLLPLLLSIGIIYLPHWDKRPESVGVYFRSAKGKRLAQLAAGLALILTPLWVIADEKLFSWVSWLPFLPQWITMGLLPLSSIAFFLLLLDTLIQRGFRASLEERVLFHASFWFVAFLVLTAIGIFFRGHGMELILPWQDI